MGLDQGEIGQVTSKSKVRLSDIMQPAPEPEPFPGPTPAPVRAGRTHTTIYLHKRVLRELRAIALEYDRKPHDILIEGVNAALAHYGRPSVEELSKG
jgi:hypothetical protein